LWLTYQTVLPILLSVKIYILLNFQEDLMYQLTKPDNVVEILEKSVAKFQQRPFLGTKIRHCNNMNGSLMLISENAWIMSEAV